MQSLTISALVVAASLVTWVTSITATVNAQETTSNEVSAEPQYTAIAGVVATVNDEIISSADVNNRARLILLSIGVEPNEETIIQAQNRALEGLIDERIKVQEGLKWEVETSDEEVEEEISRIAQSNGASKDAFLSDIWTQGINPSTLRSQIKADVTWQRLVGGRYGSRVRISQLQIDDRLDRIRKNSEAEQFRVSEIFLPAYNQNQLAQMLQGAWDLRAQIEQGAPFGLVARQFSAAPTSQSGGELGWLSVDGMRSEISEAVLSLAPPAITEPIVTEEGVYLIALMDRRAPQTPTLSEVSLKQLSTTGPASTTISDIAIRVESCDTLDQSAAVPGLNLVDLGSVKLANLDLVHQELFSQAEVGIPVPVGKTSTGRDAVVYVCEKIMTGDSLPDRDQLEGRLREQQISMLADRYLRDLRREATIIRR